MTFFSIDGTIKFVGYHTDQLYEENYKQLDYDLRIDATNSCIFPGLIDSHTHPIWAGDRINEFKMKVNIKIEYIIITDGCKKKVNTLNKVGWRYLHDDT